MKIQNTWKKVCLVSGKPSKNAKLRKASKCQPYKLKRSTSNRSVARYDSQKQIKELTFRPHNFMLLLQCWLEWLANFFLVCCSFLAQSVDIYHNSLTVFSIDGRTSELPDTSTQNSTNADQKGHKTEFSDEKMTSGDSEVAFLVELRRTLFLKLCTIHTELVSETFQAGHDELLLTFRSFYDMGLGQK